VKLTPQQATARILENQMERGLLRWPWGWCFGQTVSRDRSGGGEGAPEAEPATLWPPAMSSQPRTLLDLFQENSFQGN